jgi:hypothetical protein
MYFVARGGGVMLFCCLLNASFATGYFKVERKMFTVNFPLITIRRAHQVEIPPCLLLSV